MAGGCVEDSGRRSGGSSLGEGQLSRPGSSRQEKQGRGALGVQGPSEHRFLLRPVDRGQRWRKIRPQQGQSS